MRDRRQGERRQQPWADPRVAVIPPEKWADYAMGMWPRNRCRVCGRDALTADHGRCAVSMAASR